MTQKQSLEKVDANALFRTDANGNSVNWWQGIEVQDIIDVKVSLRTKLLSEGCGRRIMDPLLLMSPKWFNFDITLVPYHDDSLEV